MKKIINYLDGSKYTGDLKNGKQHGQGTIVHPDGSKYFGKWKLDVIVE